MSTKLELVVFTDVINSFTHEAGIATSIKYAHSGNDGVDVGGEILVTGELFEAADDVLGRYGHLVILLELTFVHLAVSIVGTRCLRSRIFNFSFSTLKLGEHLLIAVSSHFPITVKNVLLIAFSIDVFIVGISINGILEGRGKKYSREEQFSMQKLMAVGGA